jgi:AraC-like DNA-binding protein
VVPTRIGVGDRHVGPKEPFVAAVHSDATAPLLTAFTRSLGVLHGGGVRAAAVLEWVGHPTAAIAVPAMPSSPDLRRIADALLADPARSPSAVGAENGIGASVLARRFRAETGWTPLRWRTRHVLGRAAEELRRSRRVALVAAQAGYGSPQAFARAFHREWGVAPSDLVERTRGAAVTRRRGAELGPQCNGYHIVIWVVVGSVELHVADRTMVAHAGDIACLPAGTSSGFRAGADAAVVPLGWLPGGLEVGTGVIVRTDADAPLLRLAAWAYAGAEPVTGGDPRIVLQTLLGLGEPDDIPTSVADRTYTLLERLAEQPEDSRSAADLAAQLNMAPSVLRNAVEALTGTTLATWRARTRMSWARRLLRDGLDASAVASRVGYADAAAFSRAFRRAHGCSPTGFSKRTQPYPRT